MRGNGVAVFVSGEGNAVRHGSRAKIATAISATVMVALASLSTFTQSARAETGFESPVSLGTPQIISSDIDPTTGYYTIINQIAGAERFYLNGYFGGNTMIANVEAGHVWNGHETTTGVTSYVSNSPVNDPNPQYDYHATAVGFTMVGLGPPSGFGYFYYQFGMAPAAALTSVSIATDWVGTSGEFNISSSTFVYGYKTVMVDGVSREILPGLTITKPVDVVNSSWGYEDATGSQQTTMILDSLTYHYHQVVCVAAGNHDSGNPQVGGPASGYNVIAVGALGDDTTQPPYQTIAPFSNTGPNDFYNPVTQQIIPGVRAAVSIVAPGSNLILPAYTGMTGTNHDGTLFDTSGFPADQLNQLYFIGVAGTSFASPIVAGGASLIVDAGYANFGGGQAIDGRVVKAVLLNSADKTPGWDNHTVNINGVLTTTQGLDFKVGAGAMNLDRAYDQYLSGTTGVASQRGGIVHPLGWAYAHVDKGTPNDYVLDTSLHAGDMLTTTLTWFIPVTFDSAATVDPLTDSYSDAALHDTFFDQLDLQVWRVVNGELVTLIADSTSPYNNVDHLYFAIPQDGDYAIRVSYLATTYDVQGSSTQSDDYGIAWSVTPPAPVPEPSTLLLLSLTLTPLLTRKKKVCHA